MKKILLIFLSILLFSCSSNVDDSPTSNVTTEFTDALPMNDGNYWTYDVVGTTTTNDYLYILGDEIIGTHTYKKFKTQNNTPTGFYTSTLNNNDLRKDNGKLLLTGNLNLAQGQTLPIGLDLNVVDFIIFKEYATPGELLNEKTGSFEQTVNNIPLMVEYKLKAIGGENIGTFTSPNTDVYSNVLSTKIVVNVKVTTSQIIAGLPITIIILQPQDVITSTQYLSKNIGVVYTNTLTTYSLDASIATQLGIPPTNTQTQEEFLDTFLVN
jgi:hypothetical protein